MRSHTLVCMWVLVRAKRTEMSSQTTTVGSDPRLVAACHAVAALAAAVCMIAGATSLLLLAFDLRTSGTAVSVIPLQSDSAVGFFAGGLALALLQSSPINNWRRSAGAVAASVVVLIGLLSLGQTRGLLDPSVGHYVASDATAVGMLLLGLALASIDVVSRRGLRVASLLVAPPLFVSLAAMLFFLYLEPEDEAGLWLTSAGPGASALFLVLSVGLLCARPDRGNMALATSRTTGVSSSGGSCRSPCCLFRSVSGYAWKPSEADYTVRILAWR